jgi:acetolactate synthase-like protein
VITHEWNSMNRTPIQHGGDWVAETLQAHGVRFVFTLTGGHIAPILVAAKQRGIRVIDTRHEATTVFAADAVARLTGIPGVAVVTAGPGVTNTITALKNAQMAQSPLVLIGGAAATALRGRGALQDIDQLSLVRSIVKWQKRITHARDLATTITQAFSEAQAGVPGPVFVEIPVDLLYQEAIVRQWYGITGTKGQTPAHPQPPAKQLSLQTRLVRFAQRTATQGYLRLHVSRLFAGSRKQQIMASKPPTPPSAEPEIIEQALQAFQQARRPVMIIGSQALLDPQQAYALADAISQLGIPVYLSGMARGLLGAAHPLQIRHKRREALREADLVLLAGVPCDFRLDYGNHIPRRATYIAINRNSADLKRNRRPQIAMLADPAETLRMLASHRVSNTTWNAWLATLQQRDALRETEITTQAEQRSPQINPVQLCREIAAQASERTIYIADGGDFVATASYIVRPPGPLTWLDPGPFGTLGVGAGFALAAKLCHPHAEIWLLYGDGSAGYSITEYDTFVRHGIAVIGVIGNDGGWTQIAREQIPMLGDAVATQLNQTNYEQVASGFGAVGIPVHDPELVADAFAAARSAAAEGKPVLVNIHMAKGEFRKGSLSM